MNLETTAIVKGRVSVPESTTFICVVCVHAWQCVSEYTTFMTPVWPQWIQHWDPVVSMCACVYVCVCACACVCVCACMYSVCRSLCQSTWHQYHSGPNTDILWCIHTHTHTTTPHTHSQQCINTGTLTELHPVTKRTMVNNLWSHTPFSVSMTGEIDIVARNVSADEWICS